MVMLKFELDLVSDSVARYRYYPEGDRSAAGIVEIDRSSGVVSVPVESVRGYESTYACHLFPKLRAFNVTGDFEEEGMIAWC